MRLKNVLSVLLSLLLALPILEQALLLLVFGHATTSL